MRGFSEKIFEKDSGCWEFPWRFYDLGLKNLSFSSGMDSNLEYHNGFRSLYFSHLPTPWTSIFFFEPFLGFFSRLFPPVNTHGFLQKTPGVV